jgi:hypothetical protein
MLTRALRRLLCCGGPFDLGLVSPKAGRSGTALFLARARTSFSDTWPICPSSLDPPSLCKVGRGDFVHAVIDLADRPIRDADNSNANLAVV